MRWMRHGALPVAAALLAAAPAAGAERVGAVRVAATAGFVRNLDFHDGDGALVRAYSVDTSGETAPAPLDVGRLLLEVDLALTEHLTLHGDLPFLLVRPLGPVGGREAPGDSRLGLSLSLGGPGLRYVPFVSVLLPTGEDAPGAPPPWGNGRVAITGGGVTALSVGARLEGAAGPLLASLSLEATASLPATVRYLSHPEAFDRPDLNAELSPGPALAATAGVDWPLGRWLSVSVRGRGNLKGRTGVHRARRVELLDGRGTDAPEDDVARSVLAGPSLEWVPGSQGWSVVLTPGLGVPELGLALEADLLLAGRNTRPLSRGWSPATGGFQVDSLGAEENAFWPLEPTGVRLLGDVLLGETRLRVAF